MNKQRLYRLVLYILLLLLMSPLVATLLYSLATQWSATILPEAFTLKWYVMLFSDTRFLVALFNSLWVCLTALLITAVLVIPLLFVVYYYFPALKRVMNLLILMPFAVPPVVSSVGLLELFSSEPFVLTGTAWILLGAFFTVALPFMYRAIANSMEGLNIEDMMDAAHLLGANTIQIFFMIIIPNLRKGIMVSMFLCFSLLFGEFVFANMLAGSHLETVQVYLFNMRNTSGHFGSAVVISYFVVILIMTWLAGFISKPSHAE